MTLTLTTIAVSGVFQPEFPNLFFSVLGNGKTWIITMIGPILALIPDFLYASFMYIYFPTPSEKVMKQLKGYGKILDSNN